MFVLPWGEGGRAHQRLMQIPLGTTGRIVHGGLVAAWSGVIWGQEKYIGFIKSGIAGRPIVNRTDVENNESDNPVDSYYRRKADLGTS